MIQANKTYLSFIPFSALSSWSVQSYFDQKSYYSDKYRLVQIGDLITRNMTPIRVNDHIEYKQITVKTKNGGVFLRDIKNGNEIKTKKQFIVSEGQFIMSKIDARNGAMGIIPEALSGSIVTNDFPVFDINVDLINPDYFLLNVTTDIFLKFAQSCSSGSTNRQRIDLNSFLAQKIPLPSLIEQNRLIEYYNIKIKEAENINQQANNLSQEIEGYLYKEIGLEFSADTPKGNYLDLVQFNTIEEWGVDKIKNHNNTKSTKYDLCSFEDQPILCEEIYRGKSPKYTKQSDDYILNQKCNRWNEIDMQYAKPVDSKWLDGLNKNHFTKEGDILVNSTGEGTIGRTSLVTSEYINLMYDSHVLLLRVNKVLLNPLFLTYLLNSRYGQEQINRLKSAQSTKQTELGIGNLKKIRFPLPSMPTQEKIVNYISELITEINLYRTNAKSTYAFAISEFEKEIFN